jgi:hypothetical protein
MLAFIFAIVLGSSPSVFDDSTKRVDLLELNHVVRDDGSEFVQWILWDWEPSQRAYCVVAWQRYECGDTYQVSRGRFNLTWDRCELPARIISSAVFRETWTAYDPEVENQKVWRPAMRRQLWH